jgi:hypothetical protein
MKAPEKSGAFFLRRSLASFALLFVSLRAKDGGRKSARRFSAHIPLKIHGIDRDEAAPRVPLGRIIILIRRESATPLSNGLGYALS